MVRYKNRYFAVEIEPRSGPSHAPLNIRKAALYSAILNKVQEMHGDFGSAAMRNGFTTKYCNPYTKVALIRTRHGPHRFVASILPLITEIDKIKVRFNVLYVGATMVKCFKFIRVRKLVIIFKISHNCMRMTVFINFVESSAEKT